MLNVDFLYVRDYRWKSVKYVVGMKSFSFEFWIEIIATVLSVIVGLVSVGYCVRAKYANIQTQKSGNNSKQTQIGNITINGHK